LQAGNFFSSEGAGLSAGQIAKADGADSGAYQVFGMQVKMRENTADFAVFAFNQANVKRFGSELFDAFRLVADIVNDKPRAKLVDERGGYLGSRLNVVLFFYTAGRMTQFVRKIAVVGKNDKAGRHKIEPANAVKPFMNFLRQQAAGKGAVLRVSLRAKKAGRLVQHKVM
jgi:hypothetical protein